jgi:hypothetical protein
MSGGGEMILQILVYFGIGLILFLAGRNVYRAWREDREAEEWVIKSVDKE